MITLDTAAQIEALGLTIYDPHFDPATLSSGTPTFLTGPDPNIDAQLAALIAEPMLTIDGRTLATGYKYTLNVTNALQLRARHWYMELQEYNTANPATSSPAFAYCGFLLVPDVATGWSFSAGSNGQTIGLATCAAICHTWAQIIRLWVAGNYPPKPI